MPAQTQKDRDEVYESMYEAQTDSGVASKEEEKKEEPKAVIDSTEKESSETDSVKKEDIKKDEVIDEVIEEEKKESLTPDETKKQGDLKAALRESRQKLKEYKKDTEDKINQLGAELSLLKSQLPTGDKKQSEELSEFATDEEKRIFELQDTIQKQQKVLTEIDQWRKEQVQNEERKVKDAEMSDLISDIKKVSADLEAEGFPGFNRFYYLISAKLKGMPEEERLERDTKEGWKELYKEEFPSLKSVFISEDINSKFNKKNEAKRSVDMLGESKSGKKGGDEPYTNEDYFKSRGARI